MEKCSQERWLSAWRGKRIIVAMLDGKKVQGVLVGSDPFTLCLENESVGRMLLFKHAVKYVYQVE